MRFYTQDNLWLEQVGVDVWRIGLTKTATRPTRPNGVTSSWNYEDKRNLLTQVQKVRSAISVIQIMPSATVLL